MTWNGPSEVVNPNGSAAIVFTCDHASNALPGAIPDLGLSAADMERHIAWDIGAGPITRYLARAFDAPAILCGTSRLVIDCNRQLHDPTLVPPSSDGTTVPANINLSPAARDERVRNYFLPYHAACRRVIEAQCSRGARPLFVAIHSMTDRMNGAFRPWEISLSSDRNREPTEKLLRALRAVPGLCVGDNQPYDMDPLQDYSTPEHALSRGLPYLQVELRQDLIGTAAGQERMARILAEAMAAAFGFEIFA